MQFNHVVTAVLDLHTRHSDFGVMPQHLVKFYMAQMANTVTETQSSAI